MFSACGFPGRRPFRYQLRVRRSLGGGAPSISYWLFVAYVGSDLFLVGHLCRRLFWRTLLSVRVGCTSMRSSITCGAPNQYVVHLFGWTRICMDGETALV